MAGISLEKRAEKVGIILEKRSVVTIPPVRVGLALDVSGSAKWMYVNGIMQEAVNRLQAIALKFDDNGELDMWTFTDKFNRLETASASDYDNYVKREIMENENITKWNGTSYAPIMRDMMNFYFPQSGKAQEVPVKKSGGMLGGLFGRKKEVAPAVSSATTELPACVLFVTDGQTFDKAQTERVIQESQAYNIYWQMIGVGKPDEFEFIDEMGEKYPNVGYVNLSSLDMSDDELYEALLAEEFCGWIKSR